MPVIVDFRNHYGSYLIGIVMKATVNIFVLLFLD
jgi:hypothetical protein